MSNVEDKILCALQVEGYIDFDENTIYEIADGESIEALAQYAGIAKEDVKITFVNNRIVDIDTVLSDGDRVGLAPAVGGM